MRCMMGFSTSIFLLKIKMKDTFRTRDIKTPHTYHIRRTPLYRITYLDDI
jgi:hypothetical protein